MGIFSNKQPTDQPVQDGYVQDPAVAAADSTDAQSTQIAPPADLSQNPFPTQSAPPLDDASGNDAGEYIMAEPPIPSEPAAAPEPPMQDDQPAADNAFSAPDDTQAPQDNPVPPAPEPAEDAPAADQSDQTPAETEGDESPITVRRSPSQNSGLEELANIKQNALKQLAPLVPHLEQSPEEKFHTAMMMLQATDDASLVQPAYEAANAITDEKARAQALLDIVNEINYLTQKNN